MIENMPGCSTNAHIHNKVLRAYYKGESFRAPCGIDRQAALRTALPDTVRLI